MDQREYLKSYVRQKVVGLPESSKFTEKKIDVLVSNLLTTNRSLDELIMVIDQQFKEESLKEEHNKNLHDLESCYKESVEPLKGNNNCYLFSYKEGIKIVEPAHLDELKVINKLTKMVRINKEKIGYLKEYSPYELIMNHISYVLNVTVSSAYCVFDKNMQTMGILSLEDVSDFTKVLSLEETLKFVHEESPRFTEKNYLLDYHDKHIKQGLKEIIDSKSYKDNIDYVFRLFKSLPDIKNSNIERLKEDYINYLVLQILLNNVNVNLSSVGILIKKENNRYSYALTTIYSKFASTLPRLKDNQMICNFGIVDKKELIHKVISTYYKYSKELVTLIVNNKVVLLDLIDKVISEHIDFKTYKDYYRKVTENVFLLESELNLKKQVSEDTLEDKKIYNRNNKVFQDKISGVNDASLEEEVDDNRGSVVISAVITAVLLLTVALILLVIYAVSKMDM